MALLHYLYVRAKDYGITLSALNCDHAIRGEESKRDSAFVADWCKRYGVPLISFVNEEEQWKKSEESARVWRRNCFLRGARAQTLLDGAHWDGYEMLATAHHLNDNAETVLFRLARGSGGKGMCGISDRERLGDLILIRPLLSVSRKEIDEYIEKNEIPYVTDQSNFTDAYTRNKIRAEVLPALERAVPGAVKAIARYADLVAEDEEFFSREVSKYLSGGSSYGYKIADCQERVIFKRAVVQIMQWEGQQDYTAEQLSTLYRLQFSPCGKKYQFLGWTAFKEKDDVAFCRDSFLDRTAQPEPFFRFLQGKERYDDEPFCLRKTLSEEQGKTLKFDVNKIPKDAVVRFFQPSDEFRRFGGGNKKLGDYFTDEKIPLRLRRRIPLIAIGNKILLVGGMEISEEIKITDGEERGKVLFLTCRNYKML